MQHFVVFELLCFELLRHAFAFKLCLVPPEEMFPAANQHACPFMPIHALSCPLMHTDKDAQSAVVLDLDYAEHFDIVSPCAVYKRLLGRAPRVFVGSAKELVWSTVELAEHLAQHYQSRVSS